MKRMSWALAVAVLLGDISGCKSEEEAPPPPPPTGDLYANADALAASKPATPAPTPPVPKADDLTVVPGSRVGPITRKVSRKDLDTLFGEKACRDTTFTLDDGTVEAATRLQRGPDDSATLIWYDASRMQIKEVRELGKAWRTPEGVAVGSTVEDVEKAAGTFKIYGFGWDYAGTVNLEGTRYHRYRNRLFLRMAPSVRDPDRVLSASGDRPYSSAEPEMRSVAPVVAEMVVSLEPTESDDSE